MTRCCSRCGEPLGDVIYGGECGPHMLSDFVQVDGYVVDVGDLYGDWDMPDYFVLPADKLGKQRPCWKHKDGCCHYRDIPDADDSDYCRICRDVMEPAGKWAAAVLSSDREGEVTE